MFLDCALFTSQLTGGPTTAGQLQFLNFYSVAEKGLGPTYRRANVMWEPEVQRLQHGGVFHPTLYKPPFSFSVPETPPQANKLLIPHPAFTNKDEGTLTSLSCPAYPRLLVVTSQFILLRLCHRVKWGGEGVFLQLTNPVSKSKGRHTGTNTQASLSWRTPQLSFPVSPSTQWSAPSQIVLFIEFHIPW